MKLLLKTNLKHESSPASFVVRFARASSLHLMKRNNDVMASDV